RWFLLVHPGDLAAPGWLAALADIEAKTGDDDQQTLAVIMAADLPQKSFNLRGAGALPVPDRGTLAISADANGLVLTGAFAFHDPADAHAFRAGLDSARASALGSFASRFLLRQVSLEGAATRLTLAETGAFVTFSTSVSKDEAAAILARAA